MLIPQGAYRQVGRSQGRRRTGLAELRRQLADPSRVSDGARRRLLDLATRLSRVQALGGGYGRVCFSEFATAGLGQSVPTA